MALFKNTHDWKAELEQAVEQEDRSALLQAAKGGMGRTLRYLRGRLSSTDKALKSKAIRSLGIVVGADGLMQQERVRELLRNLFWAMNDESSAVPFGVPEGIGEILAVRPELQAEFLPMLCSLAYQEDFLQTGPIERGAYWALGRVGAPVAACSPEAVQAVAHAAEHHPDPETRKIASWALSKFS